MKTLLQLVLSVVAALILGGCETDLPPAPKTEGPLVRGLTGQGKVVPIDKKNDPMISTTPGAAN